MTIGAVKRRNLASRHGIGWILLSAMAPSTAALAADAVPPLAPVHRLSDAEVDRILDAAAARREAARANDLDIDGGRPQVHGEVGFGIGTGGYRSAFGTAVVPFDDGVAILSFDRTNLGSRNRFYRHPREH